MQEKDILLKRKVTLKRKQQSPQLPQPDKKNNKFWLIFVMIIFIIGVIVSFVIFRSDGKVEDNDVVVSESSVSSDHCKTSVNNNEAFIDNTDKNRAQAKDSIVDKASSNETTRGNTIMQDNQIEKSGKGETDINIDNIKSNDNKTDIQPTDKEVNEIEANGKIDIYDLDKAYELYYFKFDSANCTDDYQIKLKHLVSVLLANPSYLIEVCAYTDNVGQINYNQSLSQHRANSIKQFLISQGVKNKITAKGLGVSILYSDNAKNRRAEFVLTN